MKKIITLTLFLTLGLTASAQGGYYFGVKGGLLVGFQNWNGFEQDPLLKYCGDLFIESRSASNEFAVFAQLGYHVKGSAIRNRLYVNPFSGGYTRPPAREFLFQNAVLGAGMKQKFDFGVSSKFFYMLGIRLDYTIDTNLDIYTDFNTLNPAYAIYPFDDPTFIRDINYGLIAGGGLEFEISDYFGLMLEFTYNPDFSNQYMQPSIPNVTDPYTGESRTISERKIRNQTFEVTLGLRFLREVIYVD
ncbi:MAG: hypothetical protein DWQ02_24405 [Bacteroidetes bacterium]|nr:MAG: hypothetical protein DWQ02_24405 [Bacteroidota bacterium]